jgi:glyoxylase-like metal-dependent hydrolase (beta-lactamase superfamily II)
VESNGEAAVIDAVRTIDVFDAFAKSRQAKIVAAIDTHLHADHISGGRALAEKMAGKYYLPEKDATEVTFAYHKLEEGSDIVIGNTQIAIQALYSPGHTIGSTSLIVDDQYLITGDILFIESIGRPDLAGKAEDWVSDLHNTLYYRYPQLSRELLVLPAHFGFVSELGDHGEVVARLGDLLVNNTGSNRKDEGEFRKIVTENLPPQPNSYQEIRQTNMGKIIPSVEEQREMEIGPNRCAVHG